MLNTCVYTGIFFLINSIIAYAYSYNTFSLLLLLLSISSIIHHSNYTLYTNIIDKIFIIGVVQYAIRLFVNKCQNCKLKDKLVNKSIVISALLLNSLFYFYGYYSDKFCYDKNYGYFYHSLLHFVSSIGIHSIILM